MKDLIKELINKEFDVSFLKSIKEFDTDIVVDNVYYYNENKDIELNSFIFEAIYNYCRIIWDSYSLNTNIMEDYIEISVNYTDSHVFFNKELFEYDYPDFEKVDFLESKLINFRHK